MAFLADLTWNVREIFRIMPNIPLQHFERSNIAKIYLIHLIYNFNVLFLFKIEYRISHNIRSGTSDLPSFFACPVCNHFFAKVVDECFCVVDNNGDVLIQELVFIWHPLNKPSNLSKSIWKYRANRMLLQVKQNDDMRVLRCETVQGSEFHIKMRCDCWTR